MGSIQKEEQLPAVNQMQNDLSYWPDVDEVISTAES